MPNLRTVWKNPLVSSFTRIYKHRVRITFRQAPRNDNMAQHEKDANSHKRKAQPDSHEDYARKSAKLQSPFPSTEYTYPHTSTLDAKYPNTLLQDSPSSMTFPEYDTKNYPNLPPLPLILGPPDYHLQTAPFTHASVSDSKYSTRTSQSNYERLEFLGDSYLELAATHLIYARFPHLLTGKQSMLREQLVRNSTLARFSRGYGFPGRLKADPIVKARARWDDKIAADLFEAYVAAIVLSDKTGGWERLQRWMTELWAGTVLELDGTEGKLGSDMVASGVEVENGSLVGEALATFGQRNGNWKDELQALIGGKFVKIDYFEEKPMATTKDGAQQHTMGVYLSGWGYKKRRIGGAVGIGKKEATILAAKDALANNTAFVEQLAQQRAAEKEQRRLDALAKDKGTDGQDAKPEYYAITTSPLGST